MGKTFAVEGGLHADASAGGGTTGQPGLKPPSEALLEVAVPGLSHPQLISRGPDPAEEPKIAVSSSSGAAKAPEQ